MIPEKTICILNPKACDGLGKARWPEIESIFRELGIPCKGILHEGDLSQKIFDLLKENSSSSVSFAGIGGDGTHHALINGMMRFQLANPDKQLPFYNIIPMGTGNNLAKSFGISSRQSMIYSELRRTVLSTVYGAEYKLDLGRIGDRYFVDAFTAGVDADILAGRDSDKKHLSKHVILFRLLKGYPLYLINVFKSLSRYAPNQAEIEVDGKPWYSGPLYNIIINNCRIYAGEFDVTDTAIANDGYLDMVIFKACRDYIWRFLLSSRFLPRKFRSLARASENKIQHVKGKTFRIKLEKEVPAQLDGETISSSREFLVETVPRAIALRIPVEPA